jgi:hypothetical protein
MSADTDHDDDSSVVQELYNVAHRLIETHGPDAEPRALKRHIQMKEIGHEPAAVIWYQILRTIREILGGGSPGA